MSSKIKLPERLTLLFHFAVWILIISQVLRLCFFVWQYDEVSWNIISVVRTLLTGLYFDIGAVAFIGLPSVLYYTLFPNRLIGTWADKALVWFFTSLTVFILIFTFFAELTFWDEFRTRFNFIAVDYLIYTHEVVANINQSYPLPFLISGVLLATAGVLFLFYKRQAFHNTFTHKISLKERGLVLAAWLVAAVLYTTFVTNNQAEWSANRYNSEISRNGIYSFFAAFRNNQMKYTEFYTSIDNNKAFGIIKNKVSTRNSRFSKGGFSIHRKVTDAAPSEEKKNVVFILVESLSGSFMKEIW